MGMSEPEIYKPDLDSINRIEVDSFFIKRSQEFAKKVEEVKINDRDLLWFLYGLLLKYGHELTKVAALMKAKAMPGWVVGLVGGLAWIIEWQRKRLKQ
jgi:hypothetical protein